MKLQYMMLAAALAMGAGAAAAQEGAPNDAQIAQIVVTANQVDIDAGKLAQTKASNGEVKKFAEQMIADHTAVNKQAKDLVTKLKVKPEENATSRSLAQGGRDNLANLRGLKKGKDFDKAYVDHEVAYHQAVLDAVDKTLVPSAKNLAQLKTLSGAAFDKAYVDHEVAYHQQVLDALDKTLVPGTKNAELKALLVKTRPAFVAHLEHAKKIRSQIGSGN